MKVVHCIYSFNPGGVEMFLLNLTAAIPRDGVETHVFSFYDGPLHEDFDNAGAKVHILGDIKKLTSHKKLYFSLKNLRPDVVNNHMNIVAGVNGLICKKLHIPFVMYSHSTRHVDFGSSYIYTALTNLSLSIAKRVKSFGVGVSKDASKMMWGDNFQDRNASYINLGIDFSRYIPIDDKDKTRKKIRRQFGIPETAYVVANVAGYRPSKNYALFIDIAAKILKKRRDVYFLMIGEGSERENMINQIKKLGIEENCRLTGFLNNVPEILKTTADLFLFTSGFEGLGLALVEAQAAGVYCVYSDVVPEEAVINRNLVKTMSLDNNPQMWADELIYAIEMKKIDTDKSDCYRIAMESDFNICKTVNSYLDLWKSLKS